MSKRKTPNQAPEWKTWTLEQLLAFVEDEGSYRKAAQALGMNTPSTLHEHIKRLKAKQERERAEANVKEASDELPVDAERLEAGLKVVGEDGKGKKADGKGTVIKFTLPEGFRLKKKYSHLASDEQFYEALMEMFGTALQLGSETLFQLMQAGGRDAKEQVIAMSTLADKLRQFRAELAALRQSETAAEARTQVAEVRAALRERFNAAKSRVAG